MNSGHVLRVLSLKFPKDGSSLVPGSRAEICVPLVAVLMSSHVSRPVVCQSQLSLAHREFCQPGVNPLVHETVFTPQKLANDAATDQGFFLESRGLGRGAAYIISMPLLCGHVSPFPEEVKCLQMHLLYFRFSL